MSSTSTSTSLPSSSTSLVPLPLPLAQSLVLSRLSTSPTLLPENLAKLVTALSLAARVSLRASALFIEAILEGLQGGTVASLGVTRRALIAAVGSARGLHYVKGGLDWSGRDEEGKKTEDAFLTLLDKYTNLGIYLIHHSFTLAELFTMSSFYLTLNTIQTVSTAAEESVRMLDSILGSNESSRALSSIITLVRNELTHSDPHSELAKRGTLASFASLTKAITAFACLQTATHRRTLKELKLRVVYDCTIVVDHDGRDEEGEGSGGMIKASSQMERVPSIESAGKYEGPKSFKRKRISSSLHGGAMELEGEKEEEGGVMTDVRGEYEKLSSRIGSPRGGRSRTNSKTTSVYDHHQQRGGEEGGIELDQPGMEGLEDWLERERREEEEDEMEGLEFELPGEDEIVQELSQLCGLPEMTSSTTPQVMVEDGTLDESELPEEVRIALRELEKEDQSEESSGAENGTRKIIRPRMKEGRGYSYEIEVEETTRTTVTTVRSIEEIDGVGVEGGKIVAQRTREKEARRKSPRKRATVDQDRDVEFEEEWVELRERGGRDRDEMDTDGEGEEFPSALNGRENLAIRSRKEALEQPVENRQRLQVVLSTMTKKFTQRKRTVRRVSDSREPSPSLPSPATSSASTSPTIGWSRSPRDPIEDLRNQSIPPKPSTSNSKSRSVFRAFSKPFNRQPSTSSTTPLSSPPLVLSPSGPPTLSPPTPRASPAPLSPTKRNHQRSISASTLAPPSASRPPADLPPQPRPLPLSPNSSHTHTSSVLTTCKHDNFNAEEEEPEPKASNFPKQHLVSNLQHFARYGSAAYGQSFLRILGLAKSEFKFPHTEIHANNHAFAHHVGIHVEDILLSSFTDPQPNLSNEKISPIVNYVAVDHSVKAIVLSCRGSLGLSDILVDLTCDYEPMPVPEGDPHGSYLVHSGMFLSATTLQRGTVHDVIKEALEKFPEYGLVMCGHSLGGGVAALLSILWATPSAAYQRREAEIIAEKGRPPSHPPLTSAFVTSFTSDLPPGRPISCFTYGVPCVASPDLAKYSRGLIISTVHNYDIVPTLSIGVLRDLKTMAMGFYAETGVAEEIVGRVVGLCQRRFMARRAARKTAGPPTPSLPGAVEDEERMTPESLTDPSEESRLVPLTDRELQVGKSSNKALEPSYTDPSLLGPDMADDVELSDWLWSLRKTIRASSDNEKLYPPGTVYVVENYTVFISSESNDGKYSRREGRRVLLRAVDDVERRFSEPIFSRSMLSDHSPKSYETNCDLLAAAAM